MDIEHYNKSFDVIARSVEEEAEHRLRTIRRQCVNEFIERLNSRQRDWEATYYGLLRESQGDKVEEKPLGQEIILQLDHLEPPPTPKPPSVIQPEPQPEQIEVVHEDAMPQVGPDLSSENNLKVSENKPEKEQFKDPRFSNEEAVKEFVRIQNFLEQTRQSVDDIVSNPAHRTFKNELNIFIRTQINSISNSDSHHLDTKTKNLTTLFQGGKIKFQDKLVDATRHPQGPLFAMDLTAQTFVTVGTKMVNSVPAIAKSMATVINGIINNSFPIFKDLIIGHIQERSPYLVPMLPQIEDFAGHENKDIRYRIACGYNYDTKTQVLEPEETYQLRMRSLALVYASILIQGHMNNAWSWLASFLSLQAQPVISATILQAFLQEASKDMSSTYGRQYKKVLTLIKSRYLELLEKVTPKTSDRQSLMRLKNLLDDEASLVAAPKVSSIFGAIRMAW